MEDELFEVVEDHQPSKQPTATTVSSSTIVVRTYVQPGAGRSAVVGRRADALHVRVAPPPANDRANAAVCALLAEFFGVAPSNVTVTRGQKSREKRVEARGVDLAYVRAQIANALAESTASAASSARHSAPRR